MLISLHKQATTTPKIRAAIQASDEPTWVVAKRYGISEQTVWKWRNRDSVHDRVADKFIQDQDWKCAKINDETIEFENWYPQQTESKGRHYRWNGKSSTAKTAVRDRLRDAPLLSISVRCLLGQCLGSVLTAVAVNGRQANYREVPDNDLTEILVDLSNANHSNRLLITVFLEERRRPVNLNLNTDTRSLGFNLPSVSWISLKEHEGIDSDSNP